MGNVKLSVCIVALNEEEYLPNLLKDISNQIYPHELMEIVLVDSGSSDDTKRIMKKFRTEATDFYDVQILDNPIGNQAAGWNVAIKGSVGDIISRIDAHAKLPSNFFSLVMEEIQSGEDIVGGKRPCIMKDNTRWGKALLATENSFFGSSINTSRRSETKQYVKTMFHASYRRKVFKEVGLFNEKLLRTEDNEIHYRMRKAGYKLYYNPRIISYQYARSSLKFMLIQKYKNGFWIGITIGVCPRCISILNLVPSVFVLGIVFTTAIALMGLWQFAAIMWGLYITFCIVNTVICIVKNPIMPTMLFMPFLFLFLHVFYGTGTIVGLINMPFKRRALINK